MLTLKHQRQVQTVLTAEVGLVLREAKALERLNMLMELSQCSPR
jgi:hypothetical protein